MPNLSKILVEPDDPKFLEAAVDPTEELLDLAKLNVREIRDEYMRRQKNFMTTPFDMDGEYLRLFPSNITVWSGTPGAGKTTLLRQLTCHLMAKNCGVFVASLEQDPVDCFMEHVRTAAGRWNPTLHQTQWFVDAYAERGLFKLWAGTDLARYGKLLAVIRVLAKQGIRHAIIDSLMCLDVSPKDIDQQQAFAKQLRQTARQSGVHIHLVAHPRKPAEAGADMDVHDIAGAKEIGGIVDNVLFVLRDKEENTLGQSKCSKMKITIRKQRNYHGGNGSIGGFFFRDFRQFSANQWATEPVRYLPDNAYEYEEERA